MSAPSIDHIGIVVAALEPAIAALSRLLPGVPIVRRTLAEVGLEIAEFKAANVTVELLQYTTQQAGLARDAMGATPGLNHLSISVPDLGSALAALAAQGVRPMAGFPRRGAHGRIAFLPRDPSTAVLFELCEPDPAEVIGGSTR